jgi:hypothetical protein
MSALNISYDFLNVSNRYTVCVYGRDYSNKKDCLSAIFERPFYWKSNIFFSYKHKITFETFKAKYFFTKINEAASPVNAILL